MSLAIYRKKRDFKKIREPRGQVAGTRCRAPIFVVQKHRASHLHYDFRLEMNGVLKSWAVPKGPSMNPADKRLAISVEDHPLAYAKFHGTIPKGQYGAGKVEIWDKGAYRVVAGNLRRGELIVELKGKKLRGQFALLLRCTPCTTGAM